MSLDQDNQDDYPNFVGYHPSPNFCQDDLQDKKKNGAWRASGISHPKNHPGVILA